MYSGQSFSKLQETTVTDKKAQLLVDGKTIDLPTYSGSVGPDVLDVRGLVAEGVFTYDPGFVSTAACESKITYIDGGKGVLLHRGYPIEQLAEGSDYLELCHLLLHGELPTPEENESFRATVRNHTMVHDQVNQFFRGFRRDAHPMAVMVAHSTSIAGDRGVYLRPWPFLDRERFHIIGID